MRSCRECWCPASLSTASRWQEMPITLTFALQDPILSSERCRDRLGRLLLRKQGQSLGERDRQGPGRRRSHRYGWFMRPDVGRNLPSFFVISFEVPRKPVSVRQMFGHRAL